MRPGRVVILRGLPGVGKSTVADMLRTRLAPALRVSEDTVRYLAWPRDLGAQSVGRAQAVCAALALEYALTGADAIVDGVLEDRLVVEAMRAGLESAGVECRVFTITCGLEDLLRRNASRSALAVVPEGRIRELFAGYDQAVGEPVGTDGIVPEETADDIVALLGEPVRRRPSAGLVLLLRHGPTEIDLERYPDPARLGLSGAGRSEIVAVRDALARTEPTAVISSPMPRAVQTAELVDDVLGLGFNVEPDLAERTLAPWHGRAYAELRAAYGDGPVDAALSGNTDGVDLPGAESLEDAAARAVRAFAGLTARGHERLLVVLHGGPHAWIVAQLLGLPGPRAARALRLGPARVTCLRPGPPFELIALNAHAADVAALVRAAR